MDEIMEKMEGTNTTISTSENAYKTLQQARCQTADIL
jgi:hypothetical protein|tara:strand:+ start:474 stop:584 length:111 start_codon:yes stop_codon:yes gene_type:complete